MVRPKLLDLFCKQGGPDWFIQVVGHFSGIEDAMWAMDIDWMNQSGLREAIPPAYTKYIGKQWKEKSWATT